jgi:hypothetical protein
MVLKLMATKLNSVTNLKNYVQMMMDKYDMFLFTKQGNGFETDGNNSVDDGQAGHVPIHETG